MNAAVHFVAGERGDYPFDLAPVAETDDVAVAAALLGQDRGLEPGVVAIGVDQPVGVIQCTPAVDEHRLHGDAVRRVRVTTTRTKAVNGSLTIAGWSAWPDRAMSAAMTKRPSAAGGFFLIVAIIAGFVWGVLRGDPLGGALIGTLVGTVLAVIVWLLDRRS